jgi:hypothetical protein
MAMPDMLQGKAVPIMRQPNHHKGAGRKPKLVRKWIKDCNVSREDARNILKDVLFNKTLAQLDGINKTEFDSLSAGHYTFVRLAIKAAREQDINTLKPLLEFTFGKDEQRIEVRDDGNLARIAEALEGMDE